MGSILLEKLEARLEDKKIFFHKLSLSEVTAITVKDNKDNFQIAVNNNKITSEVELMSVVTHEAMHIELDAFYGTLTSPTKRGKIEHKVKRKIALETIPSDALKTMLTNQVSIYEIADFFNVTEQDVLNAIEIYKVKEWTI